MRKWLPKNEGDAAGSGMLSALSAAGIAVLLAYCTYNQIHPESTNDYWQNLLLRLMLFYLFFISLRTVALIAFSFADRFFSTIPAPSRTNPLVSVIVPCFNEEKVVQSAIASILKIDYPNLEILVVDDGSTDLTLLQAQEMTADRRVRVIYQRNQGKAAALNRGIDEAAGEYVLCVDADSLLNPEVVKFGVPYLENDPYLGAVAGSVQVGNSHTVLGMFQRLEYVVGLNFHKSAQSFLSAVTIIPGPVGLFRRSAVLAVGGYNSSTFAEDCDLTIRLLMAGFRTVYCSRMVSITEAPEEFDSLLKQRYRWSRGILQAIKANSRWLLTPWRNPRNFAILLYMFIETLLIPCTNFLFAALFVQQAVRSAGSVALGPFFTQLTLLDVVLTGYSVLFERSMGGLILLATVNRITYGLSMEVLRFFSIIDELAGLPMGWNKLLRKGL